MASLFYRASPDEPRPPQLPRRRGRDARARLTCAFAVQLAVTAACGPALTPRDKYIDYLVPSGRIVSQTRATAGLKLYGDSVPANDDDLDGVDDRRAARLRDIIARFSPILVKNDYAVPWDVEETLALRYDEDAREVAYDDKPILHIDCWDLLDYDTTRLRQSSMLELSPHSQLTAECVLPDSADRIPPSSPYRGLIELIRHYHPPRVAGTVPAESHSRAVLFFDFPGTDEGSWRHIYSRLTREDRVTPRLYAHPFIHQAEGGDGDRSYEFVIQYWFFYPFNDGGNNHEGDWEHVNVRVGLSNRDTGLLSASDIERIVDPHNASILDQLVISKVDYYFHHFVMTLDYLSPDVSARDTLQWRWIRDRIEARKTELPDSLRTHPIGYIGADNIGLDQFLHWPFLKKNRDSHGTYPFTGIWKRVGPIGAAEKMKGREATRDLRGGKGLPDRYVYFDRTSITLVPDWETLHRRLERLLADQRWEDAGRLARGWAWLLLPIRWGYPVSPSPGAGSVKNADLGNAAPPGPAYNTAWNRVGATESYEPYEPYVMPAAFGMGFQDSYDTSLGFLAYPWGLKEVVPPVSFFTHVVRLFSAERKYFPRRPRRELPFRFASLGYRPTGHVWFNESGLAMGLPQEDDSEVGAFLAANPGSAIDGASFAHSSTSLTALGFLLSVHQGRFSSENNFSTSRSEVSYAIRDPSGQMIGRVAGERLDHHLTGSLMHSFGFSGLLPFVRGGYGWRWYRLRDLTLNGTPLTKRETETFGRSPWPPWNLFRPNTCHIGTGLEWFPRTSRAMWGPVGKPEWGLRLDVTLQLDSDGGLCPFSAQARALDVGVGFMLGL